MMAALAMPRANPTALPTAHGPDSPPTARPTAAPHPRSAAPPAPTAIPILPPLDASPELVDLRLAGLRQARPGLLLRREAVADLSALLAAARQDGFQLEIRSAYRSYSDQSATFEKWVAYEMSKARERGAPIKRAEAIRRAATYSAPPGLSEHQTGLTVDLLPSGAPEIGFIIPDGMQAWLNTNAYQYGWVQSYPIKLSQGLLITQQLTGYTSEPWHWRWQGRAAAQDLYDRGYLDPASLLVPPALPALCDADHNPCQILE
jgi:D-alanyl-D-alanine carboxypeptidase